MELNKDQITIKELSMAVYFQTKEIASRDRKIAELEAKLEAILSLIHGKAEDAKTKDVNIWQLNRSSLKIPK